MRRFLIVGGVSCVVFSILMVISFRLEAAPSTNILTATGILGGIEQTQDGWVITLWVGDQKASGPLSPKCLYYVNNLEVSRQFFVEGYLDQIVTVELDGRTGEVLECYVDDIRAM
jgi:hypothetical protein